MAPDAASKSAIEALFAGSFAVRRREGAFEN
jgi:hypothetical protein